jgi:hypothetical protein
VVQEQPIGAKDFTIKKKRKNTLLGLFVKIFVFYSREETSMKASVFEKK